MTDAVSSLKTLFKCLNSSLLLVLIQQSLETKFDDLFGTSAPIDPFNFNSQNGTRKDDK